MLLAQNLAMESSPGSGRKYPYVMCYNITLVEIHQFQ